MKINVGVVFGGASVEHEISIISANQVMHALNEEKYNIIPIYISKEEDFYYSLAYRNIEVFKNIDNAKKTDRVIFKKTSNKIEMHHFKNKMFGGSKITDIDIFFPVMHGTKGEDGTLQGMLEMMQATYVGCDIKGAVNGQDKVFTKNILKDNNVPVVEYDWFYKTDYFANEEETLERLEKRIGYPMIIKPASLGSSVGISKAESREKLKEAIDEAARYDIKIIVEKAIENLIEVNCAVLGDYSEQRTSAIERVFQSDEILSYKDKYQSSGSKGTKGSKDKGMAATQREIPADISPELDAQVREMGINGFKALNLAGNVRIDFLINKTDNSVYLNEVNTIPGSLAFYLWSEVGLGFDDLCEELIKIAIKRKREQKQFVTSFDTNVLQNMGSGVKGSKSKV